MNCGRMEAEFQLEKASYISHIDIGVYNLVLNNSNIVYWSKHCLNVLTIIVVLSYNNAHIGYTFDVS